MKGTAPRTEGHYAPYRFPPPPEFTPEAGNEEIKNRQLEMIDTYTQLHANLNTFLTINGGAQFGNRADDLTERLQQAHTVLGRSRLVVVRALAHIIRLGGTPPPPEKGVDDDVCRFLDTPPILNAAYEAAGVPAPPPPPPPPKRIPRVPPPGTRILPVPPGLAAPIRPRIRAQVDSEVLAWLVQDQDGPMPQRQTRAQARLAQVQALLAQAQQPRHVQPQLQPALPVPEQAQPALPVQVQPQAQQPSRPMQVPGRKRDRDDTSNSSGSKRRGR